MTGNDGRGNNPERDFDNRHASCKIAPPVFETAIKISNPRGARKFAVIIKDSIVRQHRASGTNAGIRRPGAKHVTLYATSIGGREGRSNGFR